jgi:hypothetical protein
VASRVVTVPLFEGATASKLAGPFPIDHQTQHTQSNNAMNTKSLRHGIFLRAEARYTYIALTLLNIRI